MLAVRCGETVRPLSQEWEARQHPVLSGKEKLENRN